MRRFWSVYEEAILRLHYPDSRTEHVALYLDRSVVSVYQHAAILGLKKSEEWLAGPEGYYLRRHPETGAKGRFKPGHATWNKGLRRPGWAPGRMRETQFKKGERRGAAARNWNSVGTIVVDSDGFLRIKVREYRSGERAGYGNTNVWPLLNRLVWRRHFGPIPPGHKVGFKDADRSNCAPENLELISDAEMMRRNSVHTLPAELVRVIQLDGVLKRKIRELDEARSDDTVRPSV